MIRKECSSRSHTKKTTINDQWNRNQSDRVDQYINERVQRPIRDENRVTVFERLVP